MQPRVDPGPRRKPGGNQDADEHATPARHAPGLASGASRVIADRAEGIDGASETDGIEITSAALDDEDFAAGLMVAQDGLNDEGTQNFKLVTMHSAIEALGWAD